MKDEIARNPFTFLCIMLTWLLLMLFLLGFKIHLRNEMKLNDLQLEADQAMGNNITSIIGILKSL